MNVSRKRDRENEITVESASKGSRIRTAVVGCDAPNFPSVRLSLQIRDDVMSGWFWVWVGLDELTDFVKALRHCEKTRQGEAHLSGLSPDELNFSIEQMDGWGHFHLRYSVGYTSHTERRLVTRRMSGGFDLDASLFEQHVSAFEFLLDEADLQIAEAVRKSETL